MFIYEDDVCPVDTYYATLLDAVVHDHMHDYDMLFFGHMDPLKGNIKKLVVPQWSYCMHAYVLTLRAATRILKDISKHSWNEPIDMELNHKQKRHKLKSGLVNQNYIAKHYGPILFDGNPIANKRSYGCVAQDNSMMTSIKQSHLQSWSSW